AETPPHSAKAVWNVAWRACHAEAAQHQRAAKAGGDRTATRSGIRYGCCLPALTRLAKRPSAADLRGGIWRIGAAPARGRGAAGRVARAPASRPDRRFPFLARRLQCAKLGLRMTRVI